jgi:hypothetical protein
LAAAVNPPRAGARSDHRAAMRRAIAHARGARRTARRQLDMHRGHYIPPIPRISAASTRLRAGTLFACASQRVTIVRLADDERDQTAGDACACVIARLGAQEARIETTL